MSEVKQNREEIIAEARKTSLQSSIDWYHDKETGQFQDSEGNALGFAFFPEKRTFVTSEGYEIVFRRVNMNAVANFSIAYENKYSPKVPQKHVKIDEGEYDLIGNADDPRYKDELAKYSRRAEVVATAYQFSLSVKNKLPDESAWEEHFRMALEALQELYDEPLKDYMIRYEWINSLLPTNAELMVFIQIVLGAELPTVEALRKAEARFSSQSEQNGHS